MFFLISVYSSYKDSRSNLSSATKSFASIPNVDDILNQLSGNESSPQMNNNNSSGGLPSKGKINIPNAENSHHYDVENSSSFYSENKKVNHEHMRNVYSPEDFPETPNHHHFNISSEEEESEEKRSPGANNHHFDLSNAISPPKREPLMNPIYDDEKEDVDYHSILPLSTKSSAAVPARRRRDGVSSREILIHVDEAPEFLSENDEYDSLPENDEYDSLPSEKEQEIVFNYHFSFHLEFS